MVLADGADGAVGSADEGGGKPLLLDVPLHAPSVVAISKTARVLCAKSMGFIVFSRASL
jgi:hypothetical protein